MLTVRNKRTVIKQWSQKWPSFYFSISNIRCVVVVVVVIGQTVGSIFSRTLAYDCLCTLELCTA